MSPYCTRSLRFAFLALLVLTAQFASAQQSSTSSTQALSLLQKSLAALTGSQSVSDVTLSGTARRIAGSTDETGTVTVKALAAGAARMDLNLSSGLRSEVINISGAPAGNWSGPDGVSHAISNHNLFTDPAWFPAFTLSRLLSAQSAVITYVGPETRDGQSVIHVTAVANNRDNTRSQNFTYDSLNRLSTGQTQTTGVTIPNSNCWGLTFGYDPWGNMLTSSTTGPSGCSEPLPLNATVAPSNRLATNTVAGTVTNYCYDAPGNLIHTVTAPATCPTSGPYQYTYDAENHLISAGGVITLMTATASACKSPTADSIGTA